MRRIFISYRRDDSEGQAGRLFDDLTAHFGSDAVFMDVAAIRKGLDFRRIIHEHVTSCGVLLVIIGKRWLSVTDGKGRRRLDDPNDFVRLEIAAALSRGIPVVPVRVHDAAMPTEQELPDALKELAFRNGTELTHARWNSDVSLLIDDIRPYIETPAPPAREAPAGDAERQHAPQRRRTLGSSVWAAGGAAVVAAAVSVIGYHLLQDRPKPSAPDRAFAAVQPPIVVGGAAVARAPDAAEEAAKQNAMAQAAAAKAAAEKAAAEKALADAAAARAAAERAAAARRAAEEKRRREEAERAAQLAEEQRRRDEDQRKRDEENRRLAAEKAERERLAAEQAEAAKIFKTFAEAIIGSRQNNRR
jgi:flagellar biosynthesis GTPase FlhF